MDAKIQNLVDMGFEYQHAKTALSLAAGSVERAIGILFHDEQARRSTRQINYPANTPFQIQGLLVSPTDLNKVHNPKQGSSRNGSKNLSVSKVHNKNLPISEVHSKNLPVSEVHSKNLPVSRTTCGNNHSCRPPEEVNQTLCPPWFNDPL